MKLIPLTQGKFAKVDDDDFEKFGGFKWCLSKVGKNGKLYAGRRYNGNVVRLHRFIMGHPAGMVVDHINHDGLDNRKENLRICTTSQNLMNRSGLQKNCTSGINGVYWNERLKKWVVWIWFEGKGKYLGLFKTKEEAATVRAKATEEYFGEFAPNGRRSLL